MSRKKKLKKKQKVDLNLDPALVAVIDCFSACGRCSYFWAGYRVIAGEKVIDTAVKENDPVWLNLPWSHAVRELLLKCYGVRFDVDYFHHEGSCKECQRQFVYYEVDVEVEAVSSEAVDSGAVGSEAVGGEAVGGEAVDSEAVGGEAVDSEAVNDEAVVVTEQRFKIERMPCVSKE